MCKTLKGVWITCVKAPHEILDNTEFTIRWSVWYLNFTGKKQTLENRLIDMDDDVVLAEYAHPIDFLWWGRYNYKCDLSGFTELGDHHLLIETTLID